jgi:AraC family transcriptional activator of pobA
MHQTAILLHYSIKSDIFPLSLTKQNQMKSIPSYELYGDFLAGSVPDAIHHETIKERGSKHDWTIRQHRHRRLAQVFLFRSPDVHFRLGEVVHTSIQPMILVVRPGIPHGFIFSEDVVGDVMSIRLDEMPVSVQNSFHQFDTETDAIFLGNDTPHFETVTTLISQLGDAYHSIGGNRTEILIGLVDLITLYLTADQQKKTTLEQPRFEGGRDRRDIQAERFCALLEGNFQQPWSVADYAGHVGVSAPHLTRICRAALGSPPNEIVRQRRVLEAKRLLEYTALSLAEIADRCGFRDAAFFSRTFKSNVGMPPKEYRQSLDH